MTVEQEVRQEIERVRGENERSPGTWLRRATPFQEARLRPDLKHDRQLACRDADVLVLAATTR